MGAQPKSVRRGPRPGRMPSVDEGERGRGATRTAGPDDAVPRREPFWTAPRPEVRPERGIVLREWPAPVRRLVGAAFVALWVAWAAVLLLGSPQSASAAALRADLDAGRVVSWRQAELPAPSGIGVSGHPRVVVVATDPRAPVDASEDPAPARALVYWTAGAPHRALVVGAPDDATLVGLVDSVRSAGVGERRDVAAGTDLGSTGRLVTVGALVVALALVLLGPPPRWGTRPFWVIAAGGILGSGVVLFAVCELLLRRSVPDDPGASHPRRLRGVVALVAVTVVNALVGGLLTMLGVPVGFTGRP